MADPGLTAERRSERLWLVAWTVVALLTRFLFLGRWSLWGDEWYSHSDAVKLGTGNMRAAELVYPLLFVLERFVLDYWPIAASLELKLRIVPALAGALAVPVLYAASAGILGKSERNFLAGFAAFSPWLLFHAQFARFYSLLLLFSAAAIFCLLQAIRQRSLRWSLVSVLFIVLGSASHPTEALLLAGLLVASMLACALRMAEPKTALGPMAALTIVIAVAALIAQSKVEDTIGHKMSLEDAGANSIPALIQGIVYNLGLPVMLLAVLGLPHLFRSSRLLFLYVVVAAGLPTLLLIVLAGLNRQVEQRYLICVVPLYFIPAAIAAAEIHRLLIARSRLLGLVVPALAFLPFAPGVLSHYVDGNRHDLKAAATQVREQWQPGDAVVSETHALFKLYSPQISDDLLLEAPPTRELSVEFKRVFKTCRRIWVVVPSEFQEMGGAQESFYRWAWNEGSLERDYRKNRLDYHQNRLLLFSVDTAKAEPWRFVAAGEESSRLRDETR